MQPSYNSCIINEKAKWHLQLIAFISNLSESLYAVTGAEVITYVYTLFYTFMISTYSIHYF